MSGADAKCQDLANNAGLDGKFMAWLSDGDGNSPSNRFDGLFTTPYYLVDGTTKIADSWLDLTTNGLQSVINMDEKGNTFEYGLGQEFELFIWSNTKVDGTMGSTRSEEERNCVNWSTESSDVLSNVGRLDLAFEFIRGVWIPLQGWTDVSSGQCSIPSRLLCFNQVPVSTHVMS